MALFGFGHRVSGSPKVQRLKESCNKALDRLDYRRKHASKKSRVDWQKQEDSIRARCDRAILATELAEERKADAAERKVSGARPARVSARQSRTAASQENRKALADFRREKREEDRDAERELKARNYKPYGQKEALDMLMHNPSCGCRRCNPSRIGYAVAGKQARMNPDTDDKWWFLGGAAAVVLGGAAVSHWAKNAMRRDGITEVTTVYDSYGQIIDQDSSARPPVVNAFPKGRPRTGDDHGAIVAMPCGTGEVPPTGVPVRNGLPEGLPAVAQPSPFDFASWPARNGAGYTWAARNPIAAKPQSGARTQTATSGGL